MIKLIGLDLDGSLLDSNGKISSDNKKAIKKCIDSGIIVSIVSGRNEGSIKPIIEELDLFETKHIAANGALMLDYKNGHKELSTIKEETYANLVKLFKEDNREFMPLNKDGYFYQNDGPLLDVIRTWISEDGLKQGNLYNLTGIYRISIIFDGEDDLNHIKSYLPEDIYGNVDKNVYDTRVKGTNKYSGITKLAKNYGINMDEVAVIGDQASDIEVLENIKNSFAPSNSETAAIEKARIVLESTNDESAVAEMIYKYILK